MLLERSLQAQEEQNQALADFRRETQEKEERRAQVDAAVAAEVASLRSELLSANAAVADLTKRVAAAAKPPHSVGILPSRRSESGVDQIMHCMHAEPWGAQITGRYMHDVWQNTKNYDPWATF